MSECEFRHNPNHDMLGMLKKVINGLLAIVAIF